MSMPQSDVEALLRRSWIPLKMTAIEPGVDKHGRHILDIVIHQSYILVSNGIVPQLFPSVSLQEADVG